MSFWTRVWAFFSKRPFQTVGREDSWWQTKPRYQLETEARVITPNAQSHATIHNVSEGGAFVRTALDLHPGEVVRIIFSALGQKIDVAVDVVYAMKGSAHGYGIRFIHTETSAPRVVELVNKLCQMGAEKPRSPDLRTQKSRKIA